MNSVGLAIAPCVAALALSACHTSPAEAPPPVVRLTSGMPGAGFHPLGEALARAYAKIAPGIGITVLESPGAVQNVQALQSGDADVGFAFADVTYLAHRGAMERQVAPFDRLRGIAVLQLTPLHLVSRPGLAIRTIADLITSGIVLNAFNVAASEMATEYLPFNEAGERLVRGTLDAAFVNAGYRAESVARATRAGGALIPVDGPSLTHLRSAYPFLRFTFIPGGTYAHHPTAVRTVGVDTLVVCREGLSDDLVYELARALFEALPQVSSEHVSLHRMDMEQAPATPIPLHHGAARYYRERELSR
jgi:TRAP transporter TAXI family solute receptor